MKTATKPENHLPPFCYDQVGNTTTMDRKHLKDTLLATDGWVFVHGCLCDIQSKHIGAGVYRVWAKVRA